MTQPHTPRPSYPITEATVILCVMCAAIVLGAARLEPASAPVARPTLASSASGDPLLPGASLFP